jgi:energy-coupling factor transporter ATP-binding protein EcfA2
MSTRRYISSFRIENFGAFYNSGYPRIELPNGENLLAYGENGSGKSSIYKAFSQFFESSQNAITFNINQLLAGQQGFVELSFTLQDDGGTSSWQPVQSDIYRFNSAGASTNTENFIKQSNKIRGFLSYQQLVKTYALPTYAGSNPNLYELIIEDLLWNHELSTSHKTIETFWNELVPDLEIADGRRNEFKTARDKLPAFNADLQALITTILPLVNGWLRDYFKNGVSVTLQTMPPPVLLGHAYIPQKQLYFNVNQFGQPYNQYHNSLNEARLSALAICIYLAGIKLNPVGTNYKILFLDDIFIGLDTSNRLPLLEVLKNDFSDFQIFITTYDRNWFELAKEQLSPGKWKLLEMYHDDIEQPAPGKGTVVIGERPVIIESNFDFLPKAKAYFEAKDYPASANYLRKEVERTLRKLLPLERRLKIDDNFGTRDETKLENLFNNFNAYVDDCNITLPNNTIDALKLYRNLVLNPQSHSDIQSPIYRSELEKAFNAIQHLSAIPEITRVVVAPLGSRFVYLNGANHNYTMELELTDNIYKVTCGTVGSISKYKFRIVDWNWSGVQFATNLAGAQMGGQQLTNFCSERRTLPQVFQIITYGGFNPMPPNQEQAISLAGQSLHQLLT